LRKSLPIDVFSAWNNEDTFPGFVSPFSIFSDRPSTSAFANIGQIEPTHPPIEQNQRPRTLGETLGISLEMSSSPFHQNQAPSSTSPFNEFKSFCPTTSHYDPKKQGFQQTSGHQDRPS
uniref:Ovule protein n=1 Tax=Schistosoma curassoni TaxID=6186 RepID=A0A183KNM4_9TREM